MTRETVLTDTEWAVLQVLANGCTMQQGAEELGMSHHTFRTHAQHIHDKLGQHTTAGCVAVAFRRGWIA